jgi:hypothetical protein
VRWPVIIIKNGELWKETTEIKITEQITRLNVSGSAIHFERKMQSRRLWNGTHKDKGKGKAKEELAENNT